MTSVAVTLAEWAAGLEPGREDLELAHRSLLDTVAVTLAAREHRVTRLAAPLTTGARWAVAGHVLDFDDLHMPSTTHVSVVCVPTALATADPAGGGGPRHGAAALTRRGGTPPARRGRQPRRPGRPSRSACPPSGSRRRWRWPC